MNTKSVVLVETSIQIDRLIGSTTTQTAIEVHLATAPCHFVSSPYIFMEFQRAVLADYGRVYHAILERKNWNDAAHALRSGPLSYRPRALGRALHILTQTMVVSHLERENALELLRVQIQYDLPLRFWRLLQPIVDPIACDLVMVGVRPTTDQHFAIADVCHKESASCYLPEFLAGHHVELLAIANYLGAHPNVLKDQVRLERLLQAVIDDPRAALGQAACWPLGDVIIVLQALPAALLWTRDADFQPLAQALGLTLYQPTLLAPTQ